MNAACWETNDEIKKWKAQYESSGNVVPWHVKLQISPRKYLNSPSQKEKIPIVWDDTLSIPDLNTQHIVQWWRGWMPNQITHINGNCKQFLVLDIILMTLVNPGRKCTPKHR